MTEERKKKGDRIVDISHRFVFTSFDKVRVASRRNQRTVPLLFWLGLSNIIMRPIRPGWKQTRPSPTLSPFFRARDRDTVYFSWKRIGRISFLIVCLKEINPLPDCPGPRVVSSSSSSSSSFPIQKPAIILRSYFSPI